MTDGLDMSVKNTKTGKSLNAYRLNARLPAPVLKTLLQGMNRPPRRLSPEDIHARLIFLIGAVLALTFFVITAGAVYALVFVTQPVGAQAPNDRDFIQLLQTLAIFLTGALGGVLAGNGLKSKPKDQTKPDTPNTNTL
jgi:hypothetical protein